MPKFPRTEAEVLALIEQMIVGLSENPDFPSPPVSSADLRTLRDAFVSSSAAQVAAQSAEEEATETKQADYKAMTAGMKADLKYSEYAVAGNDAKLKIIGWAARSPNTPMSEPGQPLMLQITQHGPGEVSLQWKRPDEGGMVAYYVVKRLYQAEGEIWTPVHTGIERNAALTNQERGKTVEYCVVAVNKAGESTPSNSVIVTV